MLIFWLAEQKLFLILSIVDGERCMEFTKTVSKSGNKPENTHSEFYKKEEKKYLIALCMMVLTFSVVYSVLSYLRYLTLNEHVFDLGVNASLAYSVLHGGTFIGQIFSGTVAMNKLIYVPVGIIYAIYPKEYMLPIYQNIFLSFSGIFVFLLADYLLKSRRIAIFVSLLWFLYFPLAGVYWFDFHYMALFPTLFLSGVYFHLIGKKRLSSVLLILGALTDLMSPLIIMIYILIFVTKGSYSKGKLVISRFEIMVLLLSMVVFIAANVFKEGTAINNYIGISSGLPLYGSFTFKSEFIVRILIPLFFIPLFGIEYLFLISPYIALIFSNSYWPYESQMFFQYPSLYASAIFISFILGLKRIRKRIKYRTLSRVLLVLVIFNIILFALFTPLGNLVTKDVPVSSHESYITGAENQKYPIYENIFPSQKDLRFLQFLSEIPYGSSVLVSGNMPQLMQGYNAICPSSNFNVTLPHYIPVDPYSRFFTMKTVSPQGQNCSVIMKVNYLLNNFHYGFVNEFEGMVVYGLNGNISSISPPQNSVSVEPIVLSNHSLILSLPLLAPGQYSILFPKTCGNIVKVSILSESQGEVGPYEIHGRNVTISSTTYIQNLKVMFTSQSYTCGVSPVVNLSTLELFAR